jgi:DNA polymerase (family 10)
VRKKLKVNEYGVFRGKTKIAGSTEEEVYSHVGLPFIAPELREDRGEIKAAIEGSLPSLVESGDIKGDLHIHTMQSNGRSTLEDFAQAAARKGYEYIAITEHSAHNTLGKGLEPKAMLKCIEQIEKFNKTCRNITVFKGAEIDILEDGSLDIRLFAVHDHYNLSRQKQTARVLRAMQSPYFQILAHPTGRKIGERSACDIDMEKIIAAAAQRGCFLECNARPTRLDIGDLYLRRAKDNGVKVVISSDAHDTGELDNMRFGVYQARRGWIEKSDIINTLSLESVRSLLELKKPNRKQSV